MSGLRSKLQDNRQENKKRLLGVLHFLGVFMAAFLVVYLSGFLPESAKRWYDWFFGVGESSPYASCTIFVWGGISIFLLFRYFKRRRTRKDQE